VPESGSDTETSLLLDNEGSVTVDRSQISRERIPKIRTSMPTTKGKSNVDTRLRDEIEIGKAKLLQWSVGM